MDGMAVSSLEICIGGEMDNALSNVLNGSLASNLKYCRTCLASGVQLRMIPTSPEEDYLIELMTSTKMSACPGRRWLCYKCSHIIKTLTMFRVVAIRSDRILKQCSTKDPPNSEMDLTQVLNSQRDASYDAQPSLSNILCIDVESHVENCSNYEATSSCVTYVRENYNTLKNYSNGMHITRITDATLGLKAESPHETSVDGYDSYPDDDNSFNVLIVGDESKLLTSGNTYTHVDRIKLEPLDSGVFDIICKYCQSAFATEDDLTGHMRLCNGKKLKKKKVKGKFQSKDGKRKKRTFQCDLCNKKFKNSSQLETHCEKQCGPSVGDSEEESSSSIFPQTQEARGGSGVRCLQCGATFKTSAGLEAHAVKKHKRKSSRRVSCQECLVEFESDHQLQEHLQSHHSQGGRLYKCHICEKAFQHPSYLKRHALVHSTVKNFKCDVCPKRFKRETELKSHKWIHTDKRPFVCEECGLSFQYESYLRLHKMSHTGEKPHVCECGKAFKTTSNLNAHRVRHTGVKMFKCEVCGKGIKSAGQLKEHLLIHTGERPFKCTSCSKAFRRAVTLRIHNRIHTGEKPFLCKECGRPFRRQGELQAHMRTHTGERPYTCDVCGKCFASNGTFLSHKRTHSGEKPFVCMICCKGFTGASYLKIHTKIHTGEKDHACPVCQYRCVSGAALRAHAVVHSGQKPYACEACPYRGVTLKHLRNHKLTHQRNSYT